MLNFYENNGLDELPHNYSHLLDNTFNLLQLT